MGQSQPPSVPDRARGRPAVREAPPQPGVRARFYEELPGAPSCAPGYAHSASSQRVYDTAFARGSAIPARYQASRTGRTPSARPRAPRHISYPPRLTRAPTLGAQALPSSTSAPSRSPHARALCECALQEHARARRSISRTRRA